MAATSAAYIAVAQQQLGKPYVYATQGPNTFDCSGLVLYCCQQVGITDCPRTSEDQWAWVSRVTAGQVQAGTLVFSQWPGDDASPGHVQIAVSSTMCVGADNPSAGVEMDSIPGESANIVGYGNIPGLTYDGGVVFAPGSSGAASQSAGPSNGLVISMTGGLEGLIAAVGLGMGVTLLIGIGIPVLAATGYLLYKVAS